MNVRLCHGHEADEFLLDKSQAAAAMCYRKQERHSWLKKPSHKFLIHYIRTFV